jgi:hypothetical protein
MDHIDETLASQSIDPDYEPSIRAGLSLAKITLNRYYSATDNSEVYRIAMGEHLLCKYGFIFNTNHYIL